MKLFVMGILEALEQAFHVGAGLRHEVCYLYKGDGNWGREGTLYGPRNVPGWVPPRTSRFGSLVGVCHAL